jgi:hypothetical protein
MRERRSNWLIDAFVPSQVAKLGVRRRAEQLEDWWLVIPGDLANSRSAVKGVKQSQFGNDLTLSDGIKSTAQPFRRREAAMILEI